MAHQPVKFFQVGSFAAGNRLRRAFGRFDKMSSFIHMFFERQKKGTARVECGGFGVELVEVQASRQEICSPARKGTSSSSSPNGSVAATCHGSFFSVMLPWLRGRP